MTAHLSTQATKRAAIPPRMLSTTESGGKVRVEYFDFTVPTATAAIADTIALVTLPEGARILGGIAVWDAMSSGAGTSQLQIGDGTTAAKYLGTTSVDAAGSADFAHTLALGYGTVPSAAVTLYATVAGEAWAADKVFAGHVLYALD